jgi:hypothetical protein
MGKPIGYGSRALFTVTQYGPKEWTRCIFLIKKYFVKKDFGNVAALTFYSSLFFSLFLSF